jgi:hypothetical protein
MSSALSPSLAFITECKTLIHNIMQSEAPAIDRANAIAFLLSNVNAWSSQIPAMLEGSGPSASANIVFAIRKELFVAPAFIHSILGIALPDLPAAFQDFLSFILKLIEAQKSDKDKPIPKAS